MCESIVCVEIGKIHSIKYSPEEKSPEFVK